MAMNWLAQPCVPLNETARTSALARQGQLTKPPGALGRLEEIAVQLAAMQGVEQPVMERIYIGIFAADHGVAEEGVSLFPQAVTAEMVRNFARGGAAISVLARQLNATLEVINLGTVSAVEPLNNVRDERIAAGTANFARQPAMSAEQCAAALQAGRDAALRAKQQGAQLFIGGEMGIANTTSASAIACALLSAAPESLAGPGTGLDSAGVSHKASVIEESLALHRAAMTSPLEVLRHVGGFEIAALAGAYIACSQAGLPVLVDGFIASAAALAALRLRPDVADWLFFGHASAEPGYLHLMAALHARPLVDLGLRLGEGSGAAVALPILRLAAALHGQMATFAEAGVAEKNDG